jgi:putative ABC transport system permease protein
LLATILKQALLLATIGIVFGLAASWALMRAISSQLFEVSTTDPLVFAITPAVLVVAVLLASYLPARRASHTDPAVVLRNS